MTKWLAARDTETSVLRVWQLQGSGALGELILDTAREGYVVRQCEWAAQRLLMWRVDGISSDLQLEVAPPGDPGRYVDENSCTAWWDPADGTMHDISRSRTPLMAATPSGEAVALIAPTFYGSDTSVELAVSLRHLPDLRETRRFVLRLGASQYANMLDTPLKPIGWSAAHDQIFALVQVRGPERRRPPRHDYPHTVLVTVSSTGEIAHLTDNASLHIWPPGNAHFWAPRALGAATLSPVMSSRGTVLTVVGPYRGQPYRLVEIGPHGVVRERTLGHDWHRGPKGVRREGHTVRTLAITPDGSRFVLQVSRDRTEEEHDSAYGEREWVWTWDVTSRAVERVALVPRITATFGWLKGRHLVVETEGAIEGRSPNRWTTQDYGLVSIPE